MNKLDEIVERYSSEGEIEAIQIANDLGLLVLAVRQLVQTKQRLIGRLEAAEDVLGNMGMDDTLDSLEENWPHRALSSDVLELIR
jgi:hypothetical protein